MVCPIDRAETRNLSSLIDRAGMVQHPAGVGGDQIVQILQAAFLPDTGVEGATWHGGFPNNLSQIVDTPSVALCPSRQRTKAVNFL